MSLFCRTWHKSAAASGYLSLGTTTTVLPDENDGTIPPISENDATIPPISGLTKKQRSSEIVNRQYWESDIT